MTDREEAFRAVLRSEEYFRSIIENASDIIAIMELDGRMRYGSPSVGEFSELAESSSGMRGIDFIHPDEAEAVAYLAFRSRTRPPPRPSNCGCAIQRYMAVLRNRGPTNLVKKGRTAAIVFNARTSPGASSSRRS